MSKTPDAPLPRLTHFRVSQYPVMGIGPQFHRNSLVHVDAPPADLVGWSLRIRGGVVCFISPPGWKPGMVSTQLPGKGRVMVFEIPRTYFHPVFDGEDAGCVDQLQRLDVGPFKPWVAPVSVDASLALDPSQMGDV